MPNKMVRKHKEGLYNSPFHTTDNDEPYTASRTPRSDSIDARVVGQQSLGVDGLHATLPCELLSVSPFSNAYPTGTQGRYWWSKPLVYFFAV